MPLNDVLTIETDSHKLEGKRPIDRNNIVAEARQNGLTPKQELFCRAISAGHTLSRAGAVAYQSDHSIAHRTLKQEKVQLRIQDLINSSNFQELARNHWQEVLSYTTDNEKLLPSVWDAKSKAIDQIARLGGWEPTRVDESKKLILKGKLTDFLPKSK